MRLLFIAADMHRGGAERQWATLIPALARRGAETRLLCLNDEGPLFDEVRAAGVPASCLHLGGRTDALALRPHQQGLTRLVASRVDRVIAVSEAQVEPLGRRGYRRERIVVVPNGLFDSDVAVRARREDTRRSLGLGERDFAVVCVANLRVEKGVRAFIEAVEAARRQVPGLRGLLAGDGPEREALEALTAGGEDVRLLGSRGDVPDLLAACDAFCLLSEAEALPMSILEAMALGLPVVTTNVGGTAEAVAHAETGLVVAPRDTGAAAAALARLAAQPEWARQLGEHGRERRRARFGGEAMVDGYERALAEVASR